MRSQAVLSFGASLQLPARPSRHLQIVPAYDLILRTRNLIAIDYFITLRLLCSRLRLSLLLLLIIIPSPSHPSPSHFSSTQGTRSPLYTRFTSPSSNRSPTTVFHPESKIPPCRTKDITSKVLPRAATTLSSHSKRKSFPFYLIFLPPVLSHGAAVALVDTS